jgi:hypothetical protein
MKKALSLALVILFAMMLLSACEQSDQPVVCYSTEDLINQEALPKDFVWYVDLCTPASSAGLFPIPDHATYAVIDTADIVPTVRRDYRDILDAKAPFHDTFFDKVAFFFSSKYENRKHDYRLKVVGMTAEEYDQKIKKYFDLNDLYYYSDRVMGVIFPVVYQGETEELIDSEYANKNILVDYDYETSVVIAYTDDELKAAGNGEYFSHYTGRIKDRYYLPYGYYDITTRTLCPYKDENDLPKYQELLGVRDDFDLRKVITCDENAVAHIPDDCHIDAYALVGDRYYAVLCENNRYYSNSIDDYEGENVFFVTVDATTGNVLYLQKFYLENCLGYKYKLCCLGEDGILYDVMIP